MAICKYCKDMEKFEKAMLKPINATVLDGLSPSGRKQYPIGAFIRDYFPNALLVLANHSLLSNEQHNPGEPMRWAKEKSVGEGDQIIRHFMEGDNVSMAWRALELLERELIK